MRRKAKLDKLSLCETHGIHVPIAEMYLNNGCQYSICRGCGENIRHDAGGFWITEEGKCELYSFVEEFLNEEAENRNEDRG